MGFLFLSHPIPPTTFVYLTWWFGLVGDCVEVPWWFGLMAWRFGEYFPFKLYKNPPTKVHSLPDQNRCAYEWSSVKTGIWTPNIGFGGGSLTNHKECIV